MSIESARAKVIASVWQAVAQSGVDLSALPREQQARLVDAIADQTLKVVDELLSESTSDFDPQPDPPGPQEDTDDDMAEEVLWKGRPFLSIAEHYTITDERIRLVRGILNREIENYELIRVQDLDFTQNLGERMVGVGDIHVRGHDASQPSVVLRNVHEPEKVYELLRRAWMRARKKHGLQFREEM